MLCTVSPRPISYSIALHCFPTSHFLQYCSALFSPRPISYSIALHCFPHVPFLTVLLCTVFTISLSKNFLHLQFYHFSTFTTCTNGDTSQCSYRCQLFLIEFFNYNNWDRLVYPPDIKNVFFCPSYYCRCVFINLK